MTKPRLIWGTRAGQQKLFTINEKAFFAKRLTGEEEIIWQEATTKMALNMQPEAQLSLITDLFVDLLARRSQGGEKVEHGFVGANIGPSNAEEIIAFLRSGTQGEGFEMNGLHGLGLKNFGEFQVGEEIFNALAISYDEMRTLLAIGPSDVDPLQLTQMQLDGDNIDIDKVRELPAITAKIQRAKFEQLDYLLERRARSPYKVGFAAASIGLDDADQVMAYLQSGELPALEGEDSPNSMRESLPTVA